MKAAMSKDTPPWNGHKAFQSIELRRTLEFRRLFYIRTDTPAGTPRYANFIVPMFDLKQSKRLRLIRMGASYAPLVPFLPLDRSSNSWREQGAARSPHSVRLSAFFDVVAITCAG
jgi:hypothetical protein